MWVKFHFFLETFVSGKFSGNFMKNIWSIIWVLKFANFGKKWRLSLSALTSPKICIVSFQKKTLERLWLWVKKQRHIFWDLDMVYEMWNDKNITHLTTQIVRHVKKNSYPKKTNKKFCEIHIIFFRVWIMYKIPRK